MQMLEWVAMGVAVWILSSLLLGALWVALCYRGWGRRAGRGRRPGRLPALSAWDAARDVGSVRDVGSMPGPRDEIERPS